MQPKSNWIILIPLDKPITSLFIPPKYQYRNEDFKSGRVEAIGPKVEFVKVGDEIAYSKDAGYLLEHNGQKRMVIRPNSILAIV